MQRTSQFVKRASFSLHFPPSQSNRRASWKDKQASEEPARRRLGLALLTIQHINSQEMIILASRKQCTVIKAMIDH
jgi:hypothetical protein